jgi:hypothetical protein
MLRFALCALWTGIQEADQIIELLTNPCRHDRQALVDWIG